MLKLANSLRWRIVRWFGLILAAIALLKYFSGPLGFRHAQPPATEVSRDLETQTLSLFDVLLRSGKILYEETQPELYTVDGFEFEFRIASVYKNKPVLAAYAPERSKAGGPFVNPDPEEVITVLGASHRLLINKYCVYRPMLVMATIEYARQTDDLDLSDINAAWTVIQAFDTPSIVIYNCGVNAGSSQGHKHLQLFPKPARELWPGQVTSTKEVATSLEFVPFKHFVLALPPNARVEHVHATYAHLLGLSQEALASSDSDSRDYNVVMTSEWIAVIPRRTAGTHGPSGANAAGMLGMVTVPDQRQKEWWAALGYTEYLKQLGVPF